MHKWHYSEEPACSCGHPEQTIDHIVNVYSQRKFDGGLSGLHECGVEAVKWLENLDIDL